MPVGLFTRVFLSFWAAILAFAVAAAAVTIVNFRAGPGSPDVIREQAAGVLLREGRPGLKTWLADHNARFPEQRTLIVDESGRDILGQQLRPRRWRGPPPHDLAMGPPPPWATAPDGPHRGPRGWMIRAEDGTPYRVMFDPPPRRGPFSPPFSTPVQFAFLGLAIVISGLVSILLARSISAPLEKLQTTAGELSRGQLAARTPLGVARRPDEIGALARELDSMAGRLAALIEARQQLLRDLSHELRSPLARLQIAVGLARQRPDAEDGPLDRIQREGEKLEQLIAQILEYARLERDPASLNLRAVDAVALVRQVIHDAEYESQRAPGHIRMLVKPDGSALPTVRADPQLLHGAVDNVIRNALRHGGEGPVDVSVVYSGREITIAVRDRGPGVPVVDLERIFQPFYRVQMPADNPAPGSGIGLAVAAKALQLHGGHIHARNAPDGGLVVTLHLPLPA